MFIYGAEDEREFDYVEGSKKGVEYWGELKEEWSTCKNGSMQSPIDISILDVGIIPTLLNLKRNYQPGNATVKNRGHDIMVRKSHSSYIYIGVHIIATLHVLLFCL